LSEDVKHKKKKNLLTNFINRSTPKLTGKEPID